MRAPKKMYWVDYSQGDGKPLRYGQRGGGKYSSLAEAKRRMNELQRLGNQARLFETQCEWEEVFDV
jgi:hypothetical protein